MSEGAAAWASYWREAGSGEGCAPQSAGIGAATRGCWQEFAATLGRKARLLDLATGNGAVLQHVRAVRPDVHLTGIDSAPDLGRPLCPGATVKAGVAMEQLPFPNGSFDAVTSQFGYEYGDTASISREIGRMLKPGGRMRLLIHHRQSPLVRHGAPRLAALRWVLGPESPLLQAERLAVARAMGALPVPPSLRAAPQQAAARFAGQPAASQVLLGALQILDLGGAQAPAMMAQLRRKAEAEIARLEALQAAAQDETSMERLEAELAAAGLVDLALITVEDGASGLIFGWLLDANSR